MNKNIIIFDLDGTLSDCTERRAQLEIDKDYEKFNADCERDVPNETIKKLLLDISNVPASDPFKEDGCKYRIYVLSGRTDKYKDGTYCWLAAYGMRDRIDLLLMRPGGDTRPDTEIKKEMVKYFKDEILFVVDDRKKVVDMWREMGVMCLDCAGYDG